MLTYAMNLMLSAIQMRTNIANVPKMLQTIIEPLNIIKLVSRVRSTAKPASKRVSVVEWVLGRVGRPFPNVLGKLLRSAASQIGPVWRNP